MDGTFQYELNLYDAHVLSVDWGFICAHNIACVYAVECRGAYTLQMIWVPLVRKHFGPYSVIIS